MRFFIGAVVLSFALASAAQQIQEAPTGFDNMSNGVADDATHQADQVKFDEVEGLDDGLGPLYNAQSCRECHQNPTSGGPSQVTELRVGHLGPNRRFQNPEIPIARGAETITGRSLVNLRAICPSGAFPNTEIQERVPRDAPFYAPARTGSDSNHRERCMAGNGIGTRSRVLVFGNATGGIIVFTVVDAGKTRPTAWIMAWPIGLWDLTRIQEMRAARVC